ncbi:hypothetical protein APICC_08150 [Apis cerana cerana]|uniref:Uncharacterized protein n=1 Tax=Apis cerana cerana TaxID=94128 RepID=A0A2A3EDP7_APICC|nr:hypothetical protein APICC_08150 [Apis cerana cerana]
MYHSYIHILAKGCPKIHARFEFCAICAVFFQDIFDDWNNENAEDDHQLVSKISDTVEIELKSLLNETKTQAINQREQSYNQINYFIRKDSMTADSSGLLKMERYTKEQRIFIVEQYFKNNKSSEMIVKKQMHPQCVTILEVSSDYSSSKMRLVRQ